MIQFNDLKNVNIDFMEINILKYWIWEQMLQRIYIIFKNNSWRYQHEPCAIWVMVILKTEEIKRLCRGKVETLAFMSAFDFSSLALKWRKVFSVEKVNFSHINCQVYRYQCFRNFLVWKCKWWYNK